MKCENRKYSLLLWLFLSVSLAGCQTSDVAATKSDIIPRSEWATLLESSPESYAKDFPTKARLITINGRGLAESQRDKRFYCSNQSCALHPGDNEIGIVYAWSQTETKQQQLRKNLGSMVLMPLVIFGGSVDPAFPLKNSHCDMTITLDARATRNYALNIVHTVQKEQPDEFQILDVDSGAVVVSSIPSCGLLFETVFPFSNKLGSDEQCAIHIFMGKDHRVDSVQFHLDNLRSRSARGRMAYTFFVEPGRHEVTASVVSNPGLSTKENAQESSVQCSAGEAQYVQIDVEGFWTSRPIISEMSAEDAQPWVSKVAAKSKLHAIEDP